MSASQFGFGKNLRLLNAKEYQQVFDNVTWKISSSHFVFLASSNTLPHPRLGLVIAKRRVRTAVHRNRIKRLLRDHFRLQQHILPDVDFIVLVRPGVDKKDNSELNREITKCLQRISKKIDKNPLS